MMNRDASRKGFYFRVVPFRIPGEICKPLGRIFLALLITATLPASAWSEPPAVPVLPPGQPVIAGNQVIFTWLVVAQGASYRIYVDGKPAATVPSPPYLAPLPDVPGQHLYQVSAINALGEEGGLSRAASVNVRDLKAPTGLKAQAGEQAGSIELVWNPTGQGTAGYKIYRSADGADPVLAGYVSAPMFNDGNVQKGVTYAYHVSSLDTTGRESPPSAFVTVIIPLEAEARSFSAALRKGRENMKFLDVEEVFTIEEIDRQPLKRVSHLRADPSGRMWVVLPLERTVLALDHTGKVLTRLGPEVFEQTGRSYTPHKMALGPDGNIYISALKDAALLCISQEGHILWIRHLDAPERSNEDVWNGFPNQYRSLEPTPSSVMCLDEEIWVSDQRFQLIYRLDYEGRVLGYVTHYIKNGNRWRLRRVGELEPMEGDRRLITLPLARKAIVVESEGEVVLELGGSMDPRFLGIHGARLLEDGTILMTDPALGSIQGFDAIRGEYLFHLAQKGSGTPLLLKRPNMADMDRDRRIWVFVAGEMRICILSPAPEGQ